MAYEIKATSAERATWPPEKNRLYNAAHDLQGMCDALLRDCEDGRIDKPAAAALARRTVDMQRYAGTLAEAIKRYNERYG
jgi:hypothetical protein